MRDGAASVKADGSSSAAVKSSFQSTRAGAASGGVSTCGGADSKRSNRPFVSNAPVVMPFSCSGGSPGPIGLLLPSGSNGLGLVRYQNRMAVGRPDASLAQRVGPASCLAAHVKYGSS